MSRAIKVLLFMAMLLTITPVAFCDQADDYNSHGTAKLEKRDWDGAIADFTKAIELKPDFAEAFNNRGYARAFKGSMSFVVRRDESDLNAAIADLTSAIKLKPDYAEAYRNRGVAKGFKKDYGGAIADFTEAIRLKPDFKLAYIGRGASEIWSGDFDVAIADFTKIIQLNPDDAFAYHRRGEAKEAKGDLDGANADYAKALQIKPDYEEVSGFRAPGSILTDTPRHPRSPAATVVKNYLVATGAAKRSGWSLSVGDTIIVTETADTAAGKATIVVRVAFKGGSGLGVQMSNGAKAMFGATVGPASPLTMYGVAVYPSNGSTYLTVSQTFFLVAENGAWKISGMAPPRLADPADTPLSPL